MEYAASIAFFKHFCGDFLKQDLNTIVRSAASWMIRRVPKDLDLEFMGR
jgi:hypothetical protein